MILSTGMNDIESIKTSVETILKENSNLSVLHCTSIYPAPRDYEAWSDTAFKRNIP